MSTPPILSPTEALWAHVLRKDKPSLPKSAGLPQIPAAPVDRNATSTRILLYDTQARLEQFSSRADNMLKGMQDANHQLKTVGMLFEKDRDTLTNDMIDLVNARSRNLSGSPLKRLSLQSFKKKMELRVEGLNQRLDALQMFNQTHCQALETQSQILKSIQDQQSALLSAVLSLLPLAQALPSQADQIKSTIREANATLTSTVMELKNDLTSSLSALRTTSSRKRRLSGAHHSPLIPKKPRIESSTSPSSTSTKSEDKAPLVPVAPLLPLRVKSPILTRTTPTISSPARIIRQRSVFATPQTKPTLPFPVTSAVMSRDHTLRQPALLQRMTSPLQKTLPATTPVPSTLSPSVTKVGQPVSTITPSRTLRPIFGQLEIHIPPVQSLRAQKTNKNVSQQSNLGPAGVKRPSPSVNSSSASTLPRPSHPLPARPSVNPNATVPQKPVGQPPMKLNLPAGLMLHPTPSFAAASKNQGRERRSPPRDGRRFIPLDDDDDDDEE
ncbi:hypothetical protein NP233_g9052 [Leucocoprinus birnbaumii]|uniref:Uncharacterized protein n=1 Tax=Leucocoprinus birnbaumii TaxID=56174 RepID=A0AAD5VL35_9AGAR|nr:hypothetical protein NP233_g9052 [Leucocoprinus birnbaumii]